MYASASVKYNLLVEGIGFLGKVENFKEPSVNTVKAKTPDGIEQDLQIIDPEGMKAEVKLASTNSVIYDAIKKRNKAKFVLKEAVLENGRNIAITHTMIGNLSAEWDSTKTKESKKQTLKINVHRYTKEIDGNEILFADVVNDIFRINGKDILEDVRSAIM